MTACMPPPSLPLDAPSEDEVEEDSEELEGPSESEELDELDDGDE